jgi:tight adherence protein C
VNAQALAGMSGVAGAFAIGAITEAMAASGDRWRRVRRRDPAGRRLTGLLLWPPAALAVALSSRIEAAPAAAGVAWVVVVAMRRFRTRQVKRHADRALPAFAGSVAAALAAGLRPVEALASASRHREDPLGLAVRRACAKVGAGVPLEEALAMLTSEIRGGRLASLCTALSVASRRGTDPTEPVRSIASAARAADLARRRERAAKAAPAIQLIVALGIVPSVLLLVAAAVLAGAGAGVSR